MTKAHEVSKMERVHPLWRMNVFRQVHKNSQFNFFGQWKLLPDNGARERSGDPLELLDLLSRYSECQGRRCWSQRNFDLTHWPTPATRKKVIGSPKL